MKSNKIILFATLILCGTLLSGIALAQTEDQTTTAEKLEVKEQKLLPDNPFYFLKEWSRSIQSALTFDKIKKAELKEQFAGERLVELKKLVEKDATNASIEKAAEKYKKEVESIKDQVDKIKDTAESNTSVDKFLDKYTKKQILQEDVLQKIENQVKPEVFEKIKEVRERQIEKFGEVMQKLEDKEKIKDRIEKQINQNFSGDAKELKAIEILNKLEVKSPEEMKDKLKEARQEIIQKLEDRIGSTPTQSQEYLKDYIREIKIDQGYCMQVYSPVCGKDGKTYGNKCYAKVAGTEVAYEGACKINECNEDKDCPVNACLEGTYCPGYKCINNACKLCVKICKNIGTRSEGYYNSCTNELIEFVNCASETETNQNSDNACVPNYCLTEPDSERCKGQGACNSGN